jgi:hypothetical protein
MISCHPSHPFPPTASCVDFFFLRILFVASAYNRGTLENALATESSNIHVDGVTIVNQPGEMSKDEITFDTEASHIVIQQTVRAAKVVEQQLHNSQRTKSFIEFRHTQRKNITRYYQGKPQMLIPQHPYQCNPKVRPGKVIKSTAVAQKVSLGNNIK